MKSVKVLIGRRSLFLLLSMGLFLFFLPQLWKSVSLISPGYIREKGAYPWIVLAFCFLWLYLKKDKVLDKISHPRLDGRYIILGLVLLIVSIIMRDVSTPTFLVFGLLAGVLGLFTVFYGGAATPLVVLLGIYGFSITFPYFFIKYFQDQYSLTTTTIVAQVLDLLGFDFSREGQVIKFLSSQGRRIVVSIGAPSSGLASMTVFIALFSLMSLDVRPPWKTWIYLFFLGVIGTSLQNILRLILIILAGYSYGYEALTMVHDYAGYVIFPLWYTFFAYIYLRMGSMGAEKDGTPRRSALSSGRDQR